MSARNAADMGLAHITLPNGTEDLACNTVEVLDNGGLMLTAILGNAKHTTILAPGQWERVEVEYP